VEQAAVEEVEAEAEEVAVVVVAAVVAAVKSKGRDLHNVWIWFDVRQSETAGGGVSTDVYNGSVHWCPTLAWAVQIGNDNY
jgi:hypothetical protein